MSQESRDSVGPTDAATGIGSLLVAGGQRFRVNDFTLFPVDDREYVLVLHNSALSRVDPPMARVLGHLHGATETSVDAIARILPGAGAAADAESVARDLLTMQVLVPPETFEAQRRAESRPDPALATLPVTHLTTHVAKDCNLRCGYCYAEFGLYGGEAGMMSEEQALRWLDFLLLNSGTSKTVTFTLFGGEPLMNWPAVRSVVAYGRRREAAFGKRIRFSLTTNGTLFTPEIIDFLVDHDVHVVVSIDGPKDVNDAQRPTANGRGSYDLIIERSAPLLARRAVPARVTLTRKCLEASRIVDALLAAGFHDVGVAPVSSTDPEFRFTPREMVVVIDEFRKLTDRFVDAALRNVFYGFSNIVGLMQQLYDGTARGHACGAGIQLMAADADGDLYLCHRFAGMKDYRLGTLAGGVDQGRRETLLRDAHVSAKDHCGTCEIRYVCAGGCYYYSALHRGDISKTWTFNCDFLRKWYRLGLGALVRILEGNPGFVDRLLGDPARDPLAAATRIV